MLRKAFCVAAALLLVVGVTLADEASGKGGKKGGKGGKKGFGTMGKVVSMDMKDGTGTITVMAKMSKDADPTEVKIAITKDTKFMVGGGRGKEGTPVKAEDVKSTFKTGTMVMVKYAKSTDDKAPKTADTVSVFAGRGKKKPDTK